MEAMGISGEDELSEMVRNFLESDSSSISARSVSSLQPHGLGGIVATLLPHRWGSLGSPDGVRGGDHWVQASIKILQWNPSSLPLSKPRNGISRENHEASVTSPNPSSVKQLQKWPTPPLPNSSGSSRKHRFPKENVPPPDPYTSPSAATKHKSSLSPRPPNSKHKSPTGSETAVSGSSGSGVKIYNEQITDLLDPKSKKPTGSTDVGKKLMVGSATIVKKVSLELGGNAMHLA
nr:kinesin-like protein KIN12B [Ipomoea batatas]